MTVLANDRANSFNMPNFNPVEESFLRTPTPALTPLQAGPSLTSNPMLQAPILSSKTASKRSPKLWPKRNANVVPINSPAPPKGEWSGVCIGSLEEFSKLHEDFGKEVKYLIADWSKRGRVGEAVQEEDLINFG